MSPSLLTRMHLDAQITNLDSIAMRHPTKPRLPAKVNAATVRQYKAQMRAYDAERLRLHVTTPEEINAECSAVRAFAISVARFLRL